MIEDSHFRRRQNFLPSIVSLDSVTCNYRVEHNNSVRFVSASQEVQMQIGEVSKIDRFNSKYSVCTDRGKLKLPWVQYLLSYRGISHQHTNQVFSIPLRVNPPIKYFRWQKYNGLNSITLRLGRFELTSLKSKANSKSTEAWMLLHDRHPYLLPYLPRPFHSDLILLIHSLHY